MALPTIDQWEHRNKTWSNRPSRASIAMQIVDVPIGQTLTTTLLESRSRMVMAIGGTSPEALREACRRALRERPGTLHRCAARRS